MRIENYGIETMQLLPRRFRGDCHLNNCHSIPSLFKLMLTPVIAVHTPPSVPIQYSNCNGLHVRFVSTSHFSGFVLLTDVGNGSMHQSSNSACYTIPKRLSNIYNTDIIPPPSHRSPQPWSLVYQFQTPNQHLHQTSQRPNPLHPQPRCQSHFPR